MMSENLATTKGLLYYFFTNVLLDDMYEYEQMFLLSRTGILYIIGLCRLYYVYNLCQSQCSPQVLKSVQTKRSSFSRPFAVIISNFITIFRERR